MPGLQILISFDRAPDRCQAQMEQAQNALSRLPGATLAIPYQSYTHLVAVRAYTGYPFLSWESPEVIFCVEGRFYDRRLAVLKEEVERYVSPLFADAVSGSSALASWLGKVDAEFVLCAVHKKTGSVLVLNDRLARLPLYYCYDKNRCLIARDLRFPVTLTKQPSCTPLAVAQHLALGHGLDERTLWDGLLRLPAAGLLAVDPHGAEVSCRTLHSFNFSDLARDRASLEQNSRQLAELFVQACTDRGRTEGTNILSLSGGLDSRSVAAGLKQARVSFTAATFCRQGHTSKREIDAARRVAERVGCEWRRLDLPPLTVDDALSLLRLKAGRNSLGLSFLLEFFKQLTAGAPRPLTLFTGDGGDQTLPQLWLPRHINTVGKLAAYILADNYLGNFTFRFDEAAALAGITPQALIDSLAGYLAALPEQTMAGKRIHYQLYGRIMQIYFEGEDRNRCFCWSTTPFYSLPFFTAAMQCPVSQKNQHRLYQAFLTNLAPNLAEVDYPNLGGPFNSSSFWWHFQLKRLKWLFPQLTKELRLRAWGARPLHRDGVLLSILAQQSKGSAISSWLSAEKLRQVLAGSQRYDSHQLYHLATMLAGMEYLAEDKSALAGFAGSLL